MATGRFRTHLRGERERRGWSQEELARRAGLSRAAVSAIETGRVVPSAAAALALAAALACRVETLFRLEEGRAAPPPWAWEPPARERRFWLAEVGGRLLRFPVEPTGAGLLPHDGTLPADLVLGGAPGVDASLADAAPTDAWSGTTPRGTTPRAETPRGETPRLHPAADPARTLVLAGCDPAVGVLAARLAGTGVRLLPYVRSSARALELLRQGAVHAAGVHLGDDPGGNARLVRDLLGAGYRLVHLARWTEGLALASGLGLSSVHAAVRAGLRWVGREEGSGARRCLDLILEGSAPAPAGYDFAASDHRGVVETIRTGWAQAGVCVQLAAEEGGLDFHAVRVESYDLCFPAGAEDDPRLAALLDAVRSHAFRALLGALPGYDARRTGELS